MKLQIVYRNPLRSLPGAVQIQMSQPAGNTAFRPVGPLPAVLGSTLPGTYHAMRGVEEISRRAPRIRSLDKPSGIWRYAAAFWIAIAFALMGLASLLDSLGVKP